jgi:hypothetical protein
MRSKRWLWGCAAMIGCVGDAPHAQTDSAHLAEAGRWAWDASAGGVKPPDEQAGQAAAAGAAASSAAADGGRFISLPRPPATMTTTTTSSTTAGPVAAALDGGAAPDAAHAPPLAAARTAAPSQAGQLVLTEIMADPQALTDAEGEWFELLNTTGTTFDLQGCEIDDGAMTTHPIEGSLVSAPGKYLTIARSAQPGFTPDRVESISLTNSADRLALSCGGIEIDRVDYDGAQGFPIVAGASASLDPKHLDARANDSASAWCAAKSSYGSDLGTPGRANPSCTGDEDAGAGSD